MSYDVYFALHGIALEASFSLFPSLVVHMQAAFGSRMTTDFGLWRPI